MNAFVVDVVECQPWVAEFCEDVWKRTRLHGSCRAFVDAEDSSWLEVVDSFRTRTASYMPLLGREATTLAVDRTILSTMTVVGKVSSVTLPGEMYPSIFEFIIDVEKDSY